MLNVDKIVTISLHENNARRESIVCELDKIHLQTEFYLATRDQENAERGCFDSHLTVCQQAISANAQSLLVFEDDVKILSSNTAALQHINSFLKCAPQFDLLYLGLIIDKMWFSGSRHIVRAKGAGAHAYILSRNGMKKLAGYRWEGKPIDKIYKQDFKCYSLYPIIAEQFPEEHFASAITPSRELMASKSALFWEDNRKKQRSILWKNWTKSLRELFKK